MGFSRNNGRNTTFVLYLKARIIKGYIRHIALSNTLLKILEKVINERIQWYLESSGQIPRNFLAFVVLNHVMIVFLFCELI